MMGVAGVRRVEKSQRRRHHLAEKKTAGAINHRNQRGVGARPMPGMDRRAVGGRQIGRIEQILDADRKPAQWRFRQRLRSLPRPLARPFHVKFGEGAEGRFMRRDRLGTQIDEPGRGEFARFDAAGEVERKQGIRSHSRQVSFSKSDRRNKC